MYSDKKIEVLQKKQFPLEIKVTENECELARRKQKISENPTFKDDIEYISEQLDLIKKQRDIYKALLEQFECSLNAQAMDVKRCYSLVDGSMKNQIKTEDFDNNLIDPLSPSYGQELGDRIDRLNFQIKNLKQAFDERSNPNSPLPREFKETVISSHYSPTKNPSIYSPLKNPKRSRFLKKQKKNKTRPKSQEIISSKLKPDNILAKSFCESSREIMENPYKHSFCNIQAQLEYFPTRIKQLECENKELEKILEKLKQKELSQSTLSLDRPLKHRKTNFDVKRKELEEFQKELEEKSKALDLKEKELNMWEMNIKTKDRKEGVVNTITISNIANPRKSQNSHYEDQTQLKKIRANSEKKKDNDEAPEKGYACKVCRIF